MATHWERIAVLESNNTIVMEQNSKEHWTLGDEIKEVKWVMTDFIETIRKTYATKDELSDLRSSIW